MLKQGEPPYRNCPKCAAVMDEKRVCPNCGYKLRGRKPSEASEVSTSNAKHREAPGKSPQQAGAFNVSLSIEVHVDCGNPQAIDSLLRFLKELREK